MHDRIEQEYHDRASEPSSLRIDIDRPAIIIVSFLCERWDPTVLFRDLRMR